MAEYVPDKASLLKIMEVVTTGDAAKYFYSQFESKLGKAKMLESSQAILAKVAEFVANVCLCEDRHEQNYWAGKLQDILTDFQNLQQKLAESSLETVVENISGNLKLDIAISNLTELLRGYSTDGEPISGDLLLALDRLFNAWMAEKDMISKGSTIYECDANGEIKKDSQGEPIRVEAEQIRELITDPDEGFAEYLSDKGMPVDVELHQYPEQQPEIEPTAQEPEPATPALEEDIPVEPVLPQQPS